MASLVNNSIKRQATYVACFVVCALMSFDAMAQSDLYNRLSRAERDIETLSRSVYKGEKLPAGMTGAIQDDQKRNAQFGVRMSDLETQIREIRGSVEQLQYSVDTLNAKVSALESNPMQQQTISTPNNSNNNVANDNNAFVTESVVYSNDTTLNTTQTLSGEETPAKIYDNAFSLLKKGDNLAAQKAFESFITSYPDDALTANARYWLGESHYVQNQYVKSARIFAEAYQKDPKGSKAPDNLLKLGLSLSGLGRKDDACVSFSQLSKEFGNTSSAIIRRAEQESKNLGC